MFLYAHCSIFSLFLTKDNFTCSVLQLVAVHIYCKLPIASQAQSYKEMCWKDAAWKEQGESSKRSKRTGPRLPGFLPCYLLFSCGYMKRMPQARQNQDDTAPFTTLCSCRERKFWQLNLILLSHLLQYKTLLN